MVDVQQAKQDHPKDYLYAYTYTFDDGSTIELAHHKIV